MSLDEDSVPNPLVGSVVKLTSFDGFSFYISRSCALSSSTLRSLLESPHRWAETSDSALPVILLESIDGQSLEIVCQYFYYRLRWDGQNPPIPPFPMNLQTAEKLLLAASFLDT